MIEQWYYLSALLFSLAGMAVLDCRYKLAFWNNRRRTLATLGIGVAVFVLWDFLGIGLGIFISGDNRYSLPLRLAPEFPLEECFFLLFLCYFTLLLYLAGRRRWPRT